jgi:DNA-binding MarR family transcriptional regulator
MSWANQMAARPAIAYAHASPEDSRELSLSYAAAAREVRRGRSEIFPQLRLREPMWDVMLELFIQQEGGCRTSLDHLTLTGELEAAVVHHAVAVLVAAGLVDRAADLFDKRVVWLTLSPAGHAGMIEHFAQAAEFMRPLAEPERSPVRAAS